MRKETTFKDLPLTCWFRFADPTEYSRHRTYRKISARTYAERDTPERVHAIGTVRVRVVLEAV